MLRGVPLLVTSGCHLMLAQQPGSIQPASAPPTLHFFAHFWINQELEGIRHCQDSDDWKRLTELHKSSSPMDDVPETTSIFYTLSASNYATLIFFFSFSIMLSSARTDTAS